MNKVLLALSLMAVYLANAQSSQVLISAPNPKNVSLQRLNHIDDLLKQYVNNAWIGGATALIAKDGKIIYHKSFGYQDLHTKKPLKNDAIYRIASQTKAITSVGVMMLYEEGKFLLDDAISKYLPQFKNPKVLQQFNASDTSYTTVPAKREITIRDLLTHTSGIGYAQIGSSQMNAIYYKAGVVGGIGVGRILLADKMKKLGALPLFNQPGERFTYGLNTDVLGYLIEVVSGMPLDQFFKQRIFEPLGMNDTYFYLPASKQARLIALSTEDERKKLGKAADTLTMNGTFYSNFPNSNGTYFSGGGGLSSTALDYSIFMQMLLNSGQYNGKRILSPASIRMMTANQIGPLTVGKGDKFGLGFEIVPQENEGKTPLSVGSFFWGGMFSSTYWIDPKEKIVAQLFINQYPMSHGEIHDKFKAMVYAALE